MPADDSGTPWFLTPPAVLVAVIAAGPLALPLVWTSGAFRRWQKWAITAAVLILTIWVLRASADIYRQLLRELADLRAVMK
jgi:hypothetical protein